MGSKLIIDESSLSLGKTYIRTEFRQLTTVCKKTIDVIMERYAMSGSLHNMLKVVRKLVQTRTLKK